MNETHGETCDRDMGTESLWENCLEKLHGILGNKITSNDMKNNTFYSEVKHIQLHESERGQ
jgi:hypothetical protein